MGDRTVPTGGDNVIVGKLELRLRSPAYPELVQYALFVDAGQVWNRGRAGTAVNFADIRVTPGVGLRLFTPVGPIRVDVGYNPYRRVPGPAYITDLSGNLICVSPGNTLRVRKASGGNRHDRSTRAIVRRPTRRRSWQELLEPADVPVLHRPTVLTMTRRRRIFLAFLAIMISVLLIVVAGVATLTQSEWGTTKLVRYAVGRVNNSIQGTLFIGRISGSIFTGMTIDTLEIRDKNDSVFVAAANVSMEYDPRDLLDRRILMRNVTIRATEGEHLRGLASGCSTSGASSRPDRRDRRRKRRDSPGDSSSSSKTSSSIRPTSRSPRGGRRTDAADPTHSRTA